MYHDIEKSDRSVQNSLVLLNQLGLQAETGYCAARGTCVRFVQDGNEPNPKGSS